MTNSPPYQMSTEMNARTKEVSRTLAGFDSETERSRDKVTPWLVFSTLSATFGSSFLFGYSVGVLNGPQNVIGQWIRNVKCKEHGSILSDDESLTDDIWCKKLDNVGESTMFTDNGELNTLWALLNCLIPGGAVFGALISSYLVNRFGPKQSLLRNNIIAIIAVLLTSLSYTAGSVAMLIVGRFISGVNSGINAGVVPSYLMEIAPAGIRGSISSVHLLIFYFGICGSQILGLPFVLGTAANWQFLLGFSAIPSLYQLATLPFCPDSPKYVCFREKDENKAVSALRKLRCRRDVRQEMDQIKLECQETENIAEVTTSDLIKDPFQRRVLSIAVWLMIWQQFSGIDAVSFYSTAIFRGAGLVGTTAQYATIGMTAVNVVVVTIALVLVEKVGRRKLLLTGYYGMVVFLIILTICQLLFKSGISGPEFPHSSNRFAWAAYASSGSLISFIIMFAIGPNTVPWILMSELFAQGPRARCSALVTATYNLFSVLITLSFPFMQAAISEYCFILFAVCIVFSIMFTHSFVIETRGKSIDEIQRELQQTFMPKCESRTSMQELTVIIPTVERANSPSLPHNLPCSAPRQQTNIR